MLAPLECPIQRKIDTNILGPNFSDPKLNQPKKSSKLCELITAKMQLSPVKIMGLAFFILNSEKVAVKKLISVGHFIHLKWGCGELEKAKCVRIYSK